MTQLSDSTYRIQNVRNHKVNVVHFDRLKRCPDNIRLPSRKNHVSQPSVSPITRLPFPGTHLELIDDDYADVIPEAVPPHGAPGRPPSIPPPTGTPRQHIPRRYPGPTTHQIGMVNMSPTNSSEFRTYSHGEGDYVVN